jgi:transcriptional regulator with XRE-family HTH domain
VASLIGELIKQKREELGLTQKQVADRLYVTQQTIARWESNQHTPPIKAVQDLAALFDVETSYFFGEQKIVAWRFNFFALLGSLVFNFLFFWIIAVVLVSFFLTFWVVTIACIFAPVVCIWQFWHGEEPFILMRLLASLVMNIAALIVSPILWKITEYIGHILKAYYRYNVNSIVYEVVPPVQRKDELDDE